MNDVASVSIAVDPTLYYWFRIGLGAIGALLWVGVGVREYSAVSKSTSFHVRIRRVVLVAFPVIYSAGYASISFYSVAHSQPVPDAFPLVVATFVQTLAVVFALFLLGRWSEK